jgi:alpha-D-xyloside xylohydrolase
MAESLRGGLSLASSGFGFWSHDIGGFEGTPTPELFKRWVAFGLLSSHSRLHGNESYRVPWLVDEESVDVLRHFTTLKYRLMPYVFAAAGQAHDEGTPVMRAMVVEFPEDPACTYLDRQYMLGDALLVAPVFTPDGEVSYYVPEGAWTRWGTGEVLQGPGWRREQHGFLDLPLLVRPGSVLAVGARSDRPDYDYADGVTLQIYQLADGAEVRTEVPAVDGSVAAVFVTRRLRQRVTVERVVGAAPWQAFVSGVSSAVAGAGASVEVTSAGLTVTPAPAASWLTIDLEE